ncbi:hypothetical protein [Archangium lipolyticum]|uniref:hypothetical protein n=1 Tax=Archangium lipolyticum TaxID=2970465 RepID=UPI002149C4FD|nr:hypothetical protein [Archangium lipolyticum]
MPVGDPNLDPNWDWTPSGAGHTLYFTDQLGIVRSTVRQLPFYTAGHPLNTLEKDMYPQDGWVLAYRDFGTPTAAPDVPFFVLYNKYRGILRVMLFNSRELTYTRFNLELSFKSSTAAGALLTYSDATRAFLNDYDATKVESFMVEANSINGWIYGDFMLTGYDPALNDATQLRLQLRGMDVSNVTLESTEFTLSQVFSDANPGSSSNLGSNLVESATKGHKYYKDVASAVKSVRETASKAADGTWWKSIVQGLVGTPSSPSALSKIAPIVGGLVGFITTFIGGLDDPAPREPLNFQGSLKMSGTITLSAPLYALDFATKYTIGGGNPPDYYRPLNDISWGIFNLASKPIVKAKVERECSRTGCVMRRTHSVDSLPSHVFNPSAGLQLVSVRYAFTYDNKVPTEFSTNSYWYFGGLAPTGMAVEVKMRTTSPTLYFDDDIVLYKVYPVAIQLVQ